MSVISHILKNTENSKRKADTKSSKPRTNVADKKERRNLSASSAKIQWHSGFYGAAELEYRDNANRLTFDQEHELGRKPQRVDLLIIKKPPETVIKNETGKIFRAVNIIEYKGPDDRLTIDDYYKGIGYGCQYKALGKTVNEYPANEMSISFFIANKPEQLICELESNGYAIEEKYPGVYHIHGDRLFAHQQIVVLGELDKKEHHHAFLILNNKATKEDFSLFFERIKNFKTQNDRHNVGAVLKVSIAANKEALANLEKEEDYVMKDILLELVKDEVEEAVRKGREAERSAAQKAAQETAEKTAKRLYATGMKSNTIASVLDCPVSTVKKWIAAT